MIINQTSNYKNVLNTWAGYSALLNVLDVSIKSTKNNIIKAIRGISQYCQVDFAMGITVSELPIVIPMSNTSAQLNRMYLLAGTELSIYKNGVALYNRVPDNIVSETKMINTDNFLIRLSTAIYNTNITDGTDLTTFINNILSNVTEIISTLEIDFECEDLINHNEKNYIITFGS